MGKKFKILIFCQKRYDEERWFSLLFETESANLIHTEYKIHLGAKQLKVDATNYSQSSVLPLTIRCCITDLTGTWISGTIFATESRLKHASPSQWQITTNLAAFNGLAMPVTPQDSAQQNRTLSKAGYWWSSFFGSSQAAERHLEWKHLNTNYASETRLDTEGLLTHFPFESRVTGTSVVQQLSIHVYLPIYQSI